MLIGIVTGVLSGLLGVGGGIVMVPALVALGYTRHRANATSLASILLVALAGAIAFAIGERVAWGTGLVLGIGGLIGSTIGAKAMRRLSGPALGVIFGFVLLSAGIRMVVGGEVSSSGVVDSAALRVLSELIIGVVAGLGSGLAGIGGGTVMVPAMVFLLGTDQHTAEGTSLVAMLFTAAAATRINSGNHFVDWRAMLVLGIVGAITAPLATSFALQTSAATLSRAFGLFAIAVGIQTILRSRKPLASVPT